MSALECVVGVLALFGLPGSRGSIDLSGATNLYVRGQEAASDTVLNGDLVPRLSTRIEWPIAELKVAYGPRLTLARMVGPGDPTFYLLHAGDASFKVETARTQFNVWETFAIGDLFIGNLMAPTSAGVDASASASASPTTPALPPFTLLPTAESLNVRSTDTRASLRYMVTSRLSSTTTGSYAISGGYGEEAQRVQPRQHAAQVTQSLGYRVKERHELSTIVSGSRLDFSNAFEHWYASTSEMWMAEWSEAFTTSLELGVAWRRTKTPDETINYNVLPNTSLLLDYASLVEHSRVDFQLRTAISPTANVLTGELQTFTTNTFGISLRRDETSATLSSTFAQTLPIHDQSSTRGFGAAVEFARSLSDWLDLTLGGRVQKQFLNSSATPYPLQWVATLGLLATTERLRKDSNK